MAQAHTTVRADLYSEVTATIIAQLEAGVRPWSKPWADGGSIVMPRRANGEHYRGVNILLLWDAMISKGLTSPTFMTFRQAQELGGSVRKGEKAAKVVYAGAVVKEMEGADGETEEQRIPYMRAYAVFNVEQIDNLPAKFYAKPSASSGEDFGSYPAAAYNLFRDAGVHVRIGGDRAFYSPSQDVVCVPSAKRFKDTSSFYAVLAHETVHWTGHVSRLDRDFSKSKRFGDKAYAQEELVAELGAAFLCADLGLALEPREDHASYLAHWIDILKADKRAIFTAASKAQAACDYIHAEAAKARMPVEAPAEPVEAPPAVGEGEEPRDPPPALCVLHAAPAEDVLALISAKAQKLVDAMRTAPKPARKAARKPSADDLAQPVKLGAKRDRQVGDYLAMWADGSSTLVRGVVYSGQPWAAAFQAADRLRRMREGSRVYREERRAWMSESGMMGLTVRSAAFHAYVAAMPMPELAALRCEATDAEIDVAGQGYGAGSEFDAHRAKRVERASPMVRKVRPAVSEAAFAARYARDVARGGGSTVVSPHSLNRGTKGRRAAEEAVARLARETVAALAEAA